MHTHGSKFVRSSRDKSSRFSLKFEKCLNELCSRDTRLTRFVVSTEASISRSGSCPFREARNQMLVDDESISTRLVYDDIGVPTSSLATWSCPRNTYARTVQTRACTTNETSHDCTTKYGPLGRGNANRQKATV